MKAKTTSDPEEAQNLIAETHYAKNLGSDLKQSPTAGVIWDLKEKPGWDEVEEWGIGETEVAIDFHLNCCGRHDNMYNNILHWLNNYNTIKTKNIFLVRKYIWPLCLSVLREKESALGGCTALGSVSTCIWSFLCGRWRLWMSQRYNILWIHAAFSECMALVCIAYALYSSGFVQYCSVEIVPNKCTSHLHIIWFSARIWRNHQWQKLYGQKYLRARSRYTKLGVDTVQTYS